MLRTEPVHIPTRHQRRRILLAAILTAVLAAAATAGGVAGWSAVTGHDWQLPRLELRNPLPHNLLDLPSTDTAATATVPTGGGGAVFPIAIIWPPVSPWGAATLAVAVWVALMVLMVRPLLRAQPDQSRRRGLATLREIHRKLGPQAIRRAGRWTLPGTSRWQRHLMPNRMFGYRLLTPTAPKSRRPVWADWEQRIRIVARTGWGKGTRLLIPIIRTLPGPALISSTEPEIFHQTIHTRTTRPPTHRQPIRWLLRLQRRTEQAAAQLFPVMVVDFSDPKDRWTDGWPQARWDPIPECTDPLIAYRRAAALLAGVDTSHDRGSDSDKFFRASATDVLTAWMHAAALSNKTVIDVLGWLRRPDDPTPRRILDDHPDADPSAAMNLTTHLDPRAARTTSGVLRYLTLALNCLATPDGQQLCTPTPGNGFDMEQFIRDNGTLYLLADPARIERTRPLLSLFAAEMFLAAERVAHTHPGNRLPLPFIAVLDELRYGVTVHNLPYVASSQRKYGIGYVYAVQSATQEETVYGPDAQALRDAAGITIIGGIDTTTAKDLADRAGSTPVRTATTTPHHHTEHTEHQPALTIADQQTLDDGHAVILARGLPPFTASAPTIYLRLRFDRKDRSSGSDYRLRVRH